MTSFRERSNPFQAGRDYYPSTNAHMTSPNDRPARRLDILVVDDEADGADLLALLLAKWGHETRIAPDGRTAFEAFSERTPDLVLLDIGLPDIDGFELARQLRRERGYTRDRGALVALTGYGQDADKQRAEQAGFDRFLIKPVDLDRLKALLEDLGAPSANESCEN